ncbi:hypothetical protein [Deinococcus alpinitundrae]|uniref:hypothetical protein n=1 Tax=Deinococcus alpinitundrae TaxID=468913 RepID=UPI001ED981C6|nr:hypothetical protein [Deinococcus alpinitundrae]
MVRPAWAKRGCCWRCCARGAVLCLESRPNDEAVPYLALGRMARRLLKAHQDAALLDPSLAPEPLEGWVRAQVAHLLPDVWPEEPGPGPLSSAAAQRRFLEAMTRLVTSLRPLALGLPGGGAGSLLFDDDQWTDERSWEAWMFIFSQPEWRALGVQVGLTFRQGELSLARLETIKRLVEGSAAVSIDLRPLDEAGVENLTDAFLEHRKQDPAAGRAVVGALWRHTGGNPLFVLETLRSLMDTGGTTAQQKELKTLPLPPQLEALLRRRLERVSAPALRLARVAAVAGSEFDAQLAAQVMAPHPLDLVQPWAELEAAQTMSGVGFVHDMMAQAARQGVPLPVRQRRPELRHGVGGGLRTATYTVQDVSVGMGAHVALPGNLNAGAGAALVPAKRTSVYAASLSKQVEGCVSALEPP